MATPSGGGMGKVRQSPSSTAIHTTAGTSSSSSSKRLEAANPQRPIPWTKQEDAFLLHLMVRSYNVKQRGKALARWDFLDSHERMHFSLPKEGQRTQEDIVQRLTTLQHRYLAYNIGLSNSERALKQRGSRPLLWEEELSAPTAGVDAANGGEDSRGGGGAVSACEQEEQESSAAAVKDHQSEQEKQQEQLQQQPRAGASEESHENEEHQEIEGEIGVSRANSRGTAQPKPGQNQREAQEDKEEECSDAAGEEQDSSSSESSDEGEDGSIEEARAEDRSRTKASSQPEQQGKDSHSGEKEPPTDHQTGKRKRKKEQTLLVKVSNKRLRIGIAPKGTKVTYFPTKGSVEIIF